MATGDNNLGRPREEGGRDRGEKRETRKRATEVEAEECMRMRYEYAAAAGNPRLQRDANMSAFYCQRIGIQISARSKHPNY